MANPLQFMFFNHMHNISHHIALYKQKEDRIMTATQQVAMNTELWQSIGAIADSDDLMRRLTRYAKRLAKEKSDPTLMTKEEFFARVDESREQRRRGEGIRFSNREEMNNWLNSL